MSRLAPPPSLAILSDIYAHTLPGWQGQAADAFTQAIEKGS